MNLSSSTLKNRAKIKLQGLYGQSLVVSLIYACIVSLCSSGSIASSFTSAFQAVGEMYGTTDSGAIASSDPFHFNVVFSPFSSLGTVALFLLTGPLMVGLAHYFLHLADRNNPQINDLFGHFKNFGNTFVLYLLTTIFTFLWSLLFIIPGIIAGISYAMAPYIIAEHPEIKAADAIKLSKEMMKGHKGEFFILQLSFIGWFLLSLLTLGIGLIFLSPYVSAAEAEFFNEVSGKNTAKRNCGVDPDGTGTFCGDAPAAAPNNGFGQPGQQPFNGGYGQPPQQPFQGGYGQPGQQPYQGDYNQPPQQPYQGSYGQPAQQPYNGGYGQPDQPRNGDGFTSPAPPQGPAYPNPPAPPQDFTGYGQPDQQ